MSLARANRLPLLPLAIFVVAIVVTCYSVVHHISVPVRSAAEAAGRVTACSITRADIALPFLHGGNLWAW